MTISPLQHDYVTKREFKDFEASIERKFVEQRKLLNEDYERHTGMIYEQMEDRLKISMEYLGAELDKKLDKEVFFEYMELLEGRLEKKLDRKEFYEYMKLFEGRLTKKIHSLAKSK